MDTNQFIRDIDKMLEAMEDPAPYRPWVTLDHWLKIATPIYGVSPFGPVPDFVEMKTAREFEDWQRNHVGLRERLDAMKA